jgi:hypothetical protein
VGVRVRASQKDQRTIPPNQNQPKTKPTKTGDPYRADHLVEGHLEALLEDTKAPLPAAEAKEVRQLLAGVGEMDGAALGALIERFGIKAPDTKNDLSPPFPFNLMFKTSIGPKGDMVGYLRPETAQGIFVNFRDLLYYNGSKLPFAAAQIGNSYRNEISPRAGLLRVREFTQAEIEHFVNPEDKSHPKFASVKDLEPLLYSRELQMGDEKRPKPMALGAAVANGVIANETLAYFIGRTWLLFGRLGVDLKRMRFRQHLQHEVCVWGGGVWGVVGSAGSGAAVGHTLCACVKTATTPHHLTKPTPNKPIKSITKTKRNQKDGALRRGLLGRRGGDELRLGRVRRPRRPLGVRPARAHGHVQDRADRVREVRGAARGRGHDGRAQQEGARLGVQARREGGGRRARGARRGGRDVLKGV